MNASSSLLVFALLAPTSLLPVRAAETGPRAESAAPAAERGKIDINTADIPALESIPEIGTNFANAVVAARPFKSVDDLDRIIKIGPEKMKQLREKVIASPAKPTAGSPGVNPIADRSKPAPFNDGKALDRKDVSERYDRANPAAEKKAPEKKK